MNDVKLRKWKKLRLDPQIWLDCLIEDSVFRILKGIPKGTKFMFTNYDFERQCLWLVLFNSSWPEVPLGEVIPEIDSPIFKKEAKNELD